QSWRPLTRSGKPSILSGSVGWTARLGSESEPLGSEPRPQGEERDARPYRPAHVPLAHRGAARWSALRGSGSSPGSRVTPPGRQAAGIDRRPEKPAGKAGERVARESAGGHSRGRLSNSPEHQVTHHRECAMSGGPLRG